MDRREDRFALLDCPVPGSDLAFVYRDGYGYTTAVIQTGNRVVHAEFRCDGVLLEEWTAVLAESISGG